MCIRDSYQSYVPTRQDSILFPRISKVSEQDSLPKQDTLLIKKDSACLLYTSYADSAQWAQTHSLSESIQAQIDAKFSNQDPNELKKERCV